MIKPNFLRLSILFISSFSLSAFAEDIGNLARDLGGTAFLGAEIIHIILILLGLGLIAGGLIRLRERRMNPEEYTWSSILLLIIFGLALIAIAFIPMPK
jgi:hypothetical protein